MSTLCINCQQAELRPGTVKLAGVVRSEPYWVEMLGLKCENCGYSTVDAKGMTEFSRLLSDQYRAAHDLLTSDQILGLRGRFKETQEQFADRCSIGIATLKRIEKGKIQDADTNKRIVENTREQIVSDGQFVYNTSGSSTQAPAQPDAYKVHGLFLCGMCINGTNHIPAVTVQTFYINNPNTSVQVGIVRHEATSDGRELEVIKAESTALLLSDINPLMLLRGHYARR